MRGFDFSSWQGVLSTLLGLSLVALIPRQGPARPGGVRQTGKGEAGQEGARGAGAKGGDQVAAGGGTGMGGAMIAGENIDDLR
jgi:hypothetical protein